MNRYYFIFFFIGFNLFAQNQNTYLDSLSNQIKTQKPKQALNSIIEIPYGSFVAELEKSEQLFNKGIELFDEKNYTESIKYFKKAADQGNADAQYELGYMYSRGEGVTLSDSEAVRWYKLAADQGDAMALYELGFMYENGYGVTQSDTEAIKYYKLAADQGDLEAKKALDRMKNK